MPPRILNFDDSLTHQKDFPFAKSATIIDLTAIGPAARLWANEAQSKAIRTNFDPGTKNAVTFLGSGDYHYVSSLLLEQFTEKLTLVVFDHHPDWDTLPPKFGCGAWVSRAIERSNIEKVILVGPASDDLNYPSIITGNRKSVHQGRVVLLPSSAPKDPPWPWKKLPQSGLNTDPRQVFLNAVQNIRTDKLYISIDKDCLTSEHALTNWEEGSLDLDFLLFCLRTLKQGWEVAGLDITGEYSAPVIPNLWKSLCSKIDHPKQFSALGFPLETVARINGATNQRIIDELAS